MKRNVKIVLKSIYNIEVEADSYSELISKSIEKLPQNLDYDILYYEINEASDETHDETFY